MKTDNGEWDEARSFAFFAALVVLVILLVATCGAPVAQAVEIYDTTLKDPYTPNGYVARTMFCNTPQDVLAAFDKIAASPNPQGARAEVMKSLLYGTRSRGLFGTPGPCMLATLRFFVGKTVASRWYGTWGVNVAEVHAYGGYDHANYRWLGVPEPLVYYSATWVVDRRALRDPE
jgi:hypothetical protein